MCDDDRQTGWSILGDILQMLVMGICMLLVWGTILCVLLRSLAEAVAPPAALP